MANNEIGIKEEQALPPAHEGSNPFDVPDESKKQRILFVIDGQVINVDDVASKENKIFEFADEKTGEVRRVERKLLSFKDGTQLVIPQSLSWEISSLRKKYGSKCHKISVKKEGSGMGTKWRAFIEL